MKRIYPIFAFIMISAPITALAENLSETQIRACQEDPNCYACIDNNNVGYCSEKPIYDVAMQKGSPTNLGKLCSLDTVKRRCQHKPIQFETIENRSDYKKLAINSNFKREFGDTAGRQWSWVITNNGQIINVKIRKRTHGCCGARDYGDEYQSVTLNIDTRESILSSDITVEGNTDNPISIGTQFETGFSYNPDITLSIAYKVKKIADGYDYICPGNPERPCMEENNTYYCSLADCMAGTYIKNEDPDTSPDDLLGDYEQTKTCSMTEPNLFPGRYMSCRRHSATTPLKDCCAGEKVNKELQETLKFGAYTYVAANPFLAWAAAIGEIMKLFGEHNVVAEWINEATSWLSGGVCEQSEMSLNTLKASGPDYGNCVKLGEFCSEYRGATVTVMGQCGYTEKGCDRIAEAYCCFDNMLAKAMAKAARTQLKIGWGTDENDNIILEADSITPGGNPCNPDKKRFNFDCRGISVQEMLKLNLDTEEYRNDIREYAEYMVSKMIDNDGKPAGKLQQILNENNAEEMIKNFLK